MPDKPDRRIARTRAALLHAFASLLLEPRRYDQVKVGDIVERANVGRSTFYEHFRNKDEILAESIRVPFSPFARSVDAGASAASLLPTLEHFWQNRDQVRSIFGAPRRKIARILADMLQTRMTDRAGRQPPAAALEARITALALAEAQVGTLAAWMGGEISCGKGAIAEVLHGMAQSSAALVCGRQR
jgi:AcrR family transcriptional regulator